MCTPEQDPLHFEPEQMSIYLNCFVMAKHLLQNLQAEYLLAKEGAEEEGFYYTPSLRKKAMTRQRQDHKKSKQYFGIRRREKI